MRAENIRIRTDVQKSPGRDTDIVKSTEHGPNISDKEPYTIFRVHQ